MNSFLSSNGGPPPPNPPSLLETIRAHKRKELEAAKQARSEADITAQARSAPPPRPFAEALRQAVAERGLGLIAECKKASPSKGLLRADFSPTALAKEYEAGGAACLSVLTDAHFFQGAAEHLTQARQACNLPVLRKDFIFDPWQLHESRALGADCILLILAMLEDEQAAELERIARQWGMDVLLEVHDEAELQRALKLQSRLLGINNRDLGSFRTDIETSARLRRHIPPGWLVVSESGIAGARDLERLRAWDIHCALVGESLMRAQDVSAATKALFAKP